MIISKKKPNVILTGLFCHQLVEKTRARKVIRRKRRTKKIMKRKKVTKRNITMNLGRIMIFEFRLKKIARIWYCLKIIELN